MFGLGRYSEQCYNPAVYTLMYAVDCSVAVYGSNASVPHCRPSPQPGSTPSGAAPYQATHEPQSGGQHDEFASVLPPAKFTLTQSTNKRAASPALTPAPPPPPVAPPPVAPLPVAPPPVAPPSACYDDEKLGSATAPRNYTNSTAQSRSFKILQGLVASDEGIHLDRVPSLLVSACNNYNQYYSLSELIFENYNISFELIFEN